MGRRVLRNNTTRDDAVYIVSCELGTDGNYEVAGLWGRWETFRNGGHLQNKSYYYGKHESNAKRHALDLISKKSAGHYVVVHAMTTLFPWELPPPSPMVERRAHTASSPDHLVTVTTGDITDTLHVRNIVFEITQPSDLIDSEDHSIRIDTLVEDKPPTEPNKFTRGGLLEF